MQLLNLRLDKFWTKNRSSAAKKGANGDRAGMMAKGKAKKSKKTPRKTPLGAAEILELADYFKGQSNALRGLAALLTDGKPTVEVEGHKMLKRGKDAINTFVGNIETALRQAGLR